MMGRIQPGRPGVYMHVWTGENLREHASEEPGFWPDFLFIPCPKVLLCEDLEEHHLTGVMDMEIPLWEPYLHPC